jgi:hypothetical protein
VSPGTGPLAGVAQVLQQNLGGQAAVRKHQRLLVAFDKFSRDPARLVQIAAPDSQRTIHHWWIIKDEILFSARRAVAIDQLKRSFHQRLGQFLGIRNGR